MCPPVLSGVSCEKPSPSPWEPVYTLPLQPPADAGLTTCSHEDQAFRSARDPFPHPSPAQHATLSFLCRFDHRPVCTGLCGLAVDEVSKGLAGDTSAEHSTAVCVSSGLLQNCWVSWGLQSSSNEFKQMRQI